MARNPKRKAKPKAKSSTTNKKNVSVRVKQKVNVRVNVKGGAAPAPVVHSVAAYTPQPGMFFGGHGGSYGPAPPSQGSHFPWESGRGSDHGHGKRPPPSHHNTGVQSERSFKSVSVHQPNSGMGIRDKMDMWERHENSGGAQGDADGMDVTPVNTQQLPPPLPVIQPQATMTPLPAPAEDGEPMSDSVPVNTQQPSHVMAAPREPPKAPPLPERSAGQEIGSLGSGGGPLSRVSTRRRAQPGYVPPKMAGKRSADEQSGRKTDIVLDKDYSGIDWGSHAPHNLPDDAPMPAPMPAPGGIVGPLVLRQRDAAAGGGGPVRVGVRPVPLRDRRINALALPPAQAHNVVVGIEEVPNEDGQLMLEGGGGVLMLEGPGNNAPLIPEDRVPRVAPWAMHLEGMSPGARPNPYDVLMGDPFVAAAERINNKRKREVRRPRVLALPAPDAVPVPEPPPRDQRSKRQARSVVEPGEAIQPLQRLQAAPHLSEAARRVIARQAALAKARVAARYAPRGDGLTLAARRRHEKLKQIAEESVGSVDHDRRASFTGSTASSLHMHSLD